MLTTQCCEAPLIKMPLPLACLQRLATPPPGTTPTLPGLETMFEDHLQLMSVLSVGCWTRLQAE